MTSSTAASGSRTTNHALASASSTAGDILPIVLIVVAILVAWRFFARLGWGWIELPPTKFWEIVGHSQHPLVLITLRGLFRKRPCYIYPYHGIVFFTWSRPEQLPAGVSLVATTDAPV